MLTKAFFDHVRSPIFQGSLLQSQVDGMNQLATAWGKWGDADLQKLAYVLATAAHETAGTMRPIKEMGSQTYLKAKPYYPYIGRGFCQLTWKANYAKADVELGLGTKLVDTPDLALDPEIAAQVIVKGMMQGWFTGKKLSNYIGANGADFVDARRIINGTDRAVMIAGYAETFRAALRLSEAAPTTKDP